MVQPYGKFSCSIPGLSKLSCVSLSQFRKYSNALDVNDNLQLASMNKRNY